MDFVVRLIGVGRKDVASEISKLINQVLTSAVDPIAKAEGFRKSGRTYRRMRFGRVEVMAVEARSWNTAARGQFDVMVGIVDPKIAATLKGESVDLTNEIGRESYRERVCQ